MLARSVALNAVGSVVALSVGFATSILLADWLGPADRGLLALMVTVGGIGLALTGLGIPTAVTYFASRRDAPHGAILGDTLVYGAVLAVVLVPAAWFLSGALADVFAHGHGGRVWALAAVLVPLTFLDWTTHNQLLGKLRFGRYNVLVILSKVATLSLVVALVAFAGLGVAGALAATLAASLVMIGGALGPVLAAGRPRLDRRLLRRMTRYGVRVQAGTLMQLLNYRFDVLVLGLFRPLDQVGAYFVAEFLAELVLTVAQSFGTSILPLVTRSEGTAEQERMTIAALRHHTVIAAAATIGNAVFSPLVILFALRGRYDDALLPFFVLLPAMLPLGTGAVVAGDLRGRARPGLSSIYAGLAVVVTVALDFALIPRLGMLGAALASVVAYGLYGAVSLRGLARVSGVSVRRLVVPTRADLAEYPRALRRLRARIAAGARRPAPSGSAGA